MNEKKIYLLIIFIIVILIIFFTIIFIDNSSRAKKKSNSSDIVLSSEYSNVINLEDKFPISDKVGKNMTYNEDNSRVQGYYEFEVTSKSKSRVYYEIYAILENNENTIHPNYVKVYLTDDNNRALVGYDGLSVPTFYNLKVSSLNPSARRLYYGYLDSYETKKFILRSWIGDAYSIGSTTKKFGMKIYSEVD